MARNTPRNVWTPQAHRAAYHAVWTKHVVVRNEFVLAEVARGRAALQAAAGDGPCAHELALH